MRLIRTLLLLTSVLALTIAAGCGSDPEPEPETSAPETTQTTFLTSDALPVIVANVIVPAGTDAGIAMRDGMLRDDTVTRAQFPEDAIVSLELIEGMVAAEDIVLGTIVTAGMFVAPRDPGGGVATTLAP